LKLIEQPVHHDGGVEVWRELRKALPSSCSIPLYADESTQKADDVRMFAGVADGVNVKLLKCGSMEQAKTMIRFARDLRMKVMLGCMIESSIGITAAAHLAPLADWIDLDGHLYVADNDYEGICYDADGALVMPGRPGIGVVPIKNSQCA
ncbi:MAG: enolase C-terminal domain-like protein, partial [Verrucomicrobiaceae bacterium]